MRLPHTLCTDACYILWFLLLCYFQILEFSIFIIFFLYNTFEEESRNLWLLRKIKISNIFYSEPNILNLIYTMLVIQYWIHNQHIYFWVCLITISPFSKVSIFQFEVYSKFIFIAKTRLEKKNIITNYILILLRIYAKGFEHLSYK